MESRNREMQFEVDADVQAVLEFMQRRIITSKLIGVAQAISQAAGLLWGQFQQEPVASFVLQGWPIVANTAGAKQSDAIESDLGPACADDDSGAGACGPAR